MRNAACVHAAKAPASNVVASRVMTARSGIARAVTALPTSLTVSPDHSRTKSRFRSTDPSSRTATGIGWSK